MVDNNWIFIGVFLLIAGIFPAAPIIMGSMIGQVQKGKLEIVFPDAARSAPAVYPQPSWDKKA